ncbi:MBL fold metallo-hydrolase [Sulfurovum sp. ST-21]|uniref:MBL fold metallo-hydrolase n=1 Tax=Sulfurovum indicum TaxID=2779528 RepID=A0A7M1S329_9BACT|nr:MBL fold metallo-hydrolase [Sulfurovum indicum]QOR61845.1 MBL fold metallo-hydrolase [Sulfurovum indicum]
MKRVTGSLIGVLLLMTGLNAFVLGKYGEFKFEKLHENIYVMHGPVTEPNKENEGFMNNPAVIEGKNGLIIVDPGGNYNIGEKVLSEIENVSKKPILAIFNTHKHGDHWFANKAIAEKYPKAVIYADEHMIAEAKAGEAEKWYNILDRMTGNLKGTKEFAYPTRALKMGDKIEVDSEIFVVRHPKTAHTDTDLLIEHVNSNTLFLGDNVMRGRFGAFDSTSSVFGNRKLLEEIMAEPEMKMYVPGHGQSGRRKETVEPYLAYLKVITEEIAKAYEDEVEPYEVADKVKARLEAYKAWDGIEHTLGRHLDKVYAEIEAMDE